MHVGSKQEPQALIVDTGSGIAAFPCQNYCKSCGTHINNHFNVDQSESKYIYQCSTDCPGNCYDQDKCMFNQRYGEGSSYSGFLVKDQVYFGDKYHDKDDAFNFTFGCVAEETHLFYSQEADGILGMTRRTSNPSMKPIYESMYENNLIDKKMFSLCLGKNGGYFQLGGFDGQSHLDDVLWLPLIDKSTYIIKLQGISMNNHMMSGIESITQGFIDSGTTFTYIPQKLIDTLKQHFDWFCKVDPENNCKGKRIDPQQEQQICFEYNEEQNPDGPKKFFQSYPLLTFKVDDNGNTLDWYPSEYLYRDQKHKYCLAIEVTQRPDQIILGGTFMRQKNFIFDVENNKVGIARASCNEDDNQILNRKDLMSEGQLFGIDRNYLAEFVQPCDKGHFTPDARSRNETIISKKSNKSDYPRYILHFLDLLIVLIALGLIYSFGKEIYLRITGRYKSNQLQNQEFQVIEFGNQNGRDNQLQEIELTDQPSTSGNSSINNTARQQQKYQNFDHINDVSVDTDDNIDSM
eukprot:403343737